uniref:NADH-ubiquinone oxidoreductase chain 6 n=1 Tax=Cleridae sp. 2 ACP-2013 TaxID=1434447 RepID=A0A3G3FX93_9CUCU|nr:NADH dehydrogenase subunit 6 [Cleridae sp. 2 ACP-2013]
MKFLFFPMLLLSTTMMFSKHPLSLGMILLIQTTLTSLMVGLMNLNFWFSYILFLIMIGGMLILFIYMTSIASNEKFKMSKTILIILYMIFISILISFFLDSQMFNLFMTNFDMKILITNYNYKFSMNKMFNFPNMFLMYMSLIYLLITLIAVVKISNFNMGPLRQMN